MSYIYTFTTWSLTLFMYLARSTMRTELAKAQRWLDAPQQRHHVQMFNSPPVRSEKHPYTHFKVHPLKSDLVPVLTEH